MPDKYSYKPGKKKKSTRRTVITQPTQAEAVTEAELTPVTDFHPIVETKTAAKARPAIAAKPAVTGEGRSISRVSDLGAELRRLAVISILIVILLVGASLILK